MKKLVSAVFVVSVAAAGVGLMGRSASAQIPNLPAPPAQAQPAINAVSPIVFQACLGQSTVASLIQAGSVLAPVPIQVNDVISPVRNALLLDVACSLFTPKIVPAACDLDTTLLTSVPPVATSGITLVTLPMPASIVATEIFAAEKMLNDYGAPAGHPVSDSLDAQLGCKR